MKDLIAVMFVAFAVWFLFALRRPLEKRTARWGKRGIGPKMSAFSIVVVSIWMLSLGGMMLSTHFVPHVPPDFEVVVVFAGFGVVVVCGVIDMILEDRKKRPNQSLEPTAPSGRGSS